MNAQEANVPKSLFFVLPLLLAGSAVCADSRSVTAPAVLSGRSTSPEARDVWFRAAVGHILEGHASSHGSMPLLPGAR